MGEPFTGSPIFTPTGQISNRKHRITFSNSPQHMKHNQPTQKEEKFMAANVETMFYTREKPWHGLGTRVEEAPASADALRLAGLDWQVIQEPIFTDNEELISGYKANVRDSDRKVLGVVSDRYKIVQNQEAFSFTDTLLGNGVRYETAGSLQEGRKVWLLARLPR